MSPALLMIVVLLLAPAPAVAQLSREQLEHAGLSDRRGATVPDVPLQGRDGRRINLRATITDRPSLLLLVDYTCTTLCGATLGALTTALEETSLELGRDYRVLVVGLDPRDGLAELEAFRIAHLARAPRAASFVFLRADAPVIDALTRSLGYVAAYDKERDQFAHPAAVFVLTDNGRVSRALDALALTPLDLRLALTEAGQGRIGSLGDHIALLCYGWDAAAGIYTFQIRRVLSLAALATVIAIIVWLALMNRRERRALRRLRP